MASTAAKTFHLLWHPGASVTEVAPPHRKGYIRAVQGTGSRARVTVVFPGQPPVTFFPAQLTLI